MLRSLGCLLCCPASIDMHRKLRRHHQQPDGATSSLAAVETISLGLRKGQRFAGLGFRGNILLFGLGPRASFTRLTGNN